MEAGQAQAFCGSMMQGRHRPVTSGMVTSVEINNGTRLRRPAALHNSAWRVVNDSSATRDCLIIRRRRTTPTSGLSATNTTPAAHKIRNNGGQLPFLMGCARDWTKAVSPLGSEET